MGVRPKPRPASAPATTSAGCGGLASERCSGIIGDNDDVELCVEIAFLELGVEEARRVVAPLLEEPASPAFIDVAAVVALVEADPLQLEREGVVGGNGGAGVKSTPVVLAISWISASEPFATRKSPTVAPSTGLTIRLTAMPFA